MEFNIYVPSYGRSDRILTKNHLDYCTYVVRKSEEAAYRDAGVESLIAVEDSEVNSAAKVYAWIWRNVPEDVFAIVDDDIEKFMYRLDDLKDISDPVQVTSEIERLAQMLVDLDLGYLACPLDSNVKFYDRPFKFVGLTGALKIYNRPKFKARDDGKLLFLADVNVEMQELLHNRVILIPNYFCLKAALDKNAGGTNGTKTLSMYDAENDIMKNKWGKYYVKANGGKAGRINVKR